MTESRIPMMAAFAAVLVASAAVTTILPVYAQTIAFNAEVKGQVKKPTGCRWNS